MGRSALGGGGQSAWRCCQRLAVGEHRLAGLFCLTRPPSAPQAGGNPFANMGGLMENIKKAQAMVQVEAAKVQEELAR